MNISKSAPLLSISVFKKSFVVYLGSTYLFLILQHEPQSSTPCLTQPTSTSVSSSNPTPTDSNRSTRPDGLNANQVTLTALQMDSLINNIANNSQSSSGSNEVDNNPQSVPLTRRRRPCIESLQTATLRPMRNNNPSSGSPLDVLSTPDVIKVLSKLSFIIIFPISS